MRFWKAKEYESLAMNLSPNSLKEVLGIASGRLALSSPTGLLDAKVILKHLTKMTDVDLILKADVPLETELVKEYFDLVARREKGEPVAYLTGEKAFMGLDFKVTKDVLIPRPETETLVEKVLELRGKGSLKGFEVGVGSGCISISLLKANPDLTMVASEISKPAIEVAQNNADMHGVSNRLKLVNANIFNEECGGRFDFLVSNPPYIGAEEYSSLMADVREFEPKRALYADCDGLDYYVRIVNAAPNLLKPGSLIAFEIGMSQGPEVSSILEGAGFRDIVVYPDLSGRDRIVMGVYAYVK